MENERRRWKDRREEGKDNEEEEEEGKRNWQTGEEGKSLVIKTLLPSPP